MPPAFRIANTHGLAAALPHAHFHARDHQLRARLLLPRARRPRAPLLLPRGLHGLRH